MSFLSAETSIFGGKPVELYEFKRGTRAWRVCTSKKQVVYNSTVFTPDYVTRDNLRSTGDLGRQQLSVTLKAAHELAASYLGGMPAQATTLTIYRQHVKEPEVGIVWAGRITSIEFADDEATLKCDPITTSLKRVGLTATYQVLCRHALFDQQCNAPRQPIGGFAAEISGFVVTVGGFELPANPKFFEGGTLASGEDAWMITGQAGTLMTLASPPIGMFSGALVTLLPGCDHTTGPNGCQKFNNLDNYGGFPFMPGRNPFGNNPIV